MAANQRDLSFLLESDKYLSGLPTIYRTMRTDEEDENKTEASRILAQEGIGSAKDIISSLGLTSAKDIIAKEKDQTDKLLTEKPATTTPPTTTPVSTQPTELPKLKTVEEIKKEREELVKTPRNLAEQFRTNQISAEELVNQMRDYQEQMRNLTKSEVSASKTEAEQRRQAEIEKAKAEREAFENKLKNSIETKKQNIFNNPELLQQAEDKYGFFVKSQAQMLDEYAGMPDEWYYASDAKERLLYANLSLDERQYYDKIKAEEYNYKKQETEFIKNFAKKLNTNVSINTIETPKFGAIDFSKITPEAGGSLYTLASFQNPNISREERGKAIYNLQQEWERKRKEIDENDSIPLVTKMDLKRQLGKKPTDSPGLGDTSKVTNYYYDMGNYVFLPESVITNGVNGAGGYHFNTAFLDKDTWVNMLEKSQPVDLSAVGEGGVKAGDTSLGRGFLFKKNDWGNFNSSLQDKWFLNSNYNNPYMPDNAPILGIGNVNGELRYIRQAGNKVGKDTVNFASIDKTGYARYSYSTKHSGLRGVAQDLVEGFAEIPFAPEVIGIATGNPAIYATLKGVQTVGQGGDLGDALKSAAIAYAGAKVTANIASYGQSVGASISSVTGLSEGVSNFIGGAVVGSATNGVIASVTGGDVNKAMLAGAIGGGFSASAADFTNTVLGGEANVANIAKAINLKPEQFQQVFTGAVANGAVAAGVYDKDFMETFSQSLVTSGLSTAAANSVSKSLGESVSPAQRKIIAQNTALFVRTAAHASIKGVGIEDAFKAIAPKAVADTLGQGLREALKSDKK